MHPTYQDAVVDSKGFSGRLRVITRKYWTLTVLVPLFLLISSLYFANLLTWSRAPDFGWSVGTETGALDVIHVSGRAAAAGLRPGDRFMAVNGRGVASLGEVRERLNRDIPGQNIYGISREDGLFTIVVQNRSMGIEKAFLQYGFTWLLGLVSFIMGVLVFYMKPGTRSSWAFLLATFTTGILITFIYTSKLSPGWLNIMLIFGSTFCIATVFHLAAVFPVEQKWVNRHWEFLAVPYSVSTLLLVTIIMATDMYADAPRYLLIPTELLRGATLLFFLGSLIFIYFKATSRTARGRAKVILFGTVVALVIPVVQLFTSIFLGIRIISHPALYMPFYAFFPLTIAFAIVQHNLFDVDVFIKRTVGYGLTTGLVFLFYLALALSVKPAAKLFPTLEELAGLYPVLFALLVFFLFRPIHGQLQKAVNRHFFRERFDYKDAVLRISNELTMVLDLRQVVVRIIHAVRDVMSVDSAGVIRLQPEIGECPALFIHDSERPDGHGGGKDHFEEDCLEFKDPLITLLEKERKLITRQDVTEDPRYGSVREECLQRFVSFKGEMALPLVFQDRLIGILVLGRKRSGRYYLREDIDLLTTLANQGAIAIENAKKAEKMKEEEVIRANLSKYLSPQVVDQVINLRLPMGLGGSRKEVTILISDIRGFTKLTQTVPPENLTRILNEYFTEMAGLIFENHGSLDKFVGDAIIAVYGAVRDEVVHLDNPTASAIKTAIDMVSRMSTLNRKWAVEYDGFHMEIGIGIDKGEVFLGNVGSPERMEFTVIGTAVNNAQFFSDTAGPSEIFLSEAAACALGGKVRVREVEGPPDHAGEQKILKVVR